MFAFTMYVVRNLNGEGISQCTDECLGEDIVAC